MVIAEAVVAAGVKRFIPAELGIDSSGPKAMEVAPCMFLKQDIITYLRKHEEKTTWTGLFCGLWLDFVSSTFSLPCSATLGCFPRKVEYLADFPLL